MEDVGERHAGVRPVAPCVGSGPRAGLDKHRVTDGRPLAGSIWAFRHRWNGSREPWMCTLRGPGGGDVPPGDVGTPAPIRSSIGPNPTVPDLRQPCGPATELLRHEGAPSARWRRRGRRRAHGPADRRQHQPSHPSRRQEPSSLHRGPGAAMVYRGTATGRLPGGQAKVCCCGCLARSPPRQQPRPAGGLAISTCPRDGGRGRYTDGSRGSRPRFWPGMRVQRTNGERTGAAVDGQP